MNQKHLAPSDYERNLGEALRTLRLRAKKRQHAVASHAGITKGMLSAYETGRQLPTLRTLFKVLATLGADMTDLEGAIYAHLGIEAPPRAPLSLAVGEDRAPRVITAGMPIDLYVGGFIRLELSGVPSAKVPTGTDESSG